MENIALNTMTGESDDQITSTEIRQINASARRTLMSEQAGLSLLTEAFENGLSTEFPKALNLIRKATGRVIVTGVGKSGHIGSKIAATLASTGTPAFFLHAAEASHGDLGMVTKQDVVIALSWSGESTELHAMLDYATRFTIPLIAITSNKQSALGRHATACLELPKAIEACPHNLAPTTSTIMQLAIGDALSVALLETRGFSANDFGLFHPGGQLGAKLKTIGEIMHHGDALPLAGLAMPMTEAIIKMSEKGFGCLGICDDAGELAGIITDGDLRRHINDNLLDLTTKDVMTPKPVTTQKKKLASAALDIMNSSGSAGITTLFVVENKKPIGLVHIHDLLRLGVA